MTQHAVYTKPAVDDDRYDEYDWSVEDTFEDKESAIDSMPDLQNPKSDLESQLVENYLYCRIEFDDDENIPNNISDRQKRELKRKNKPY